MLKEINIIGKAKPSWILNKMRLLQNTLFKPIVLAGGLALATLGCAKEPSGYVEGVVVKEYGNIPGLVESSGAWFGNESVKVDATHYGIKVETNQGVYTIDLSYDGWEGNSFYHDKGPKNVWNLSSAIVPNETRVRFPTQNLGFKHYGHGFTQDKIGQMDPDEIEILGGSK